MRRLNVVTGAVASSIALSVGAVCLDEHGISGYHIPLEKELDTADVVAIGTVVSEKRVPESSPEAYDDGSVYRFRIEETLRGHRYKTLDLFSENTSARFPMDIGRRYLVFVTKARRNFGVSNCGNSGALSERSLILEEVRKRLRNTGNG